MFLYENIKHIAILIGSAPKIMTLITARDEYLAEKSGLNVGDSLNIYSVDAAAGRIEDFYHSKGFRRTLVSVIEGNKPGDGGVVFSVHETPKERVWSVDFVGNKIVSDGRLKTQIQAKPAVLKYGLFRGTVDPAMRIFGSADGFPTAWLFPRPRRSRN